ncbi:MAG: 23S rRNA (uracil(1939)-C(5))-methyltransferase RlmD [Bacteroidales bacterium]
MSRRKKLPEYQEIVIEDIAAEGKAIAKINDLIVFVAGVVPGDVVDIQITKKRKRFQEGKVTHIHTYSSVRETPFCTHFGICGGCKWQNLPYSEQLRYKEKQVSDQLTRIGHITPENIQPILGSAHTTYYRNKLEYTFSNKRWKTKEEIEKNEIITDNNALGFHVPRLFDKIVHIDHCFLQESPSNAIRNFIYETAEKHNFTFFDIRNHHGLLRNVIIRNTTLGEVMVIIVFFENNPEKHTILLDAVSKEFPQLTSLLYIINQKKNDTIQDQEVLIYAGKDYITEEMEGLQFKIGPKSFYQTNSLQAYELYKIARNFARLTGNELVYDLYTGTGTIANFIANHAKQVIGIEYVPEAIEDARKNATINNIDNTIFFAGDMKDVLHDHFLASHGNPDVIITDPPRAGMHKDVVDTIARCAPQRIVYISCNPATQARDIALLDSYTVTKSQAVDMFPHTHHVENVVVLEKKHS